MKVLVVGTFGVGKSTFVKEIRDKFSTPHENIDVADPETICQVNRTTQDVQDINIMYHGNEIIVNDTPGMFDRLIDSYNNSCIHTERILKQIKQFNTILLCISANNYDIRDIDKKVLKILHHFPKLLNRIIVVVTKTDLVSDDKSKTFFQKCRCDQMFSKFPIYNKTDIDTILTKIVDDKVYQNEISCDNMIDESIIIPMINNIQTEMKDKNLYPGHHDSFSTHNLNITILIFGGIGLLFIPVNIIITAVFIILTLLICILASVLDIFDGYYDYNLDVGKYNNTNYNIFNNSKIKLSKKLYKNDNTKICHTIIKYGDDKKFYEGTMFGNFFERGIFYYPNGDVMYVKKA